MNTASQPYIEELKRCLLHIPVQSDFEFDENARALLRKVLCQAVSCGGQYYTTLFPKLATEGATRQSIYGVLEKELSWLFTSYDTRVPVPEDCKALPQDAPSHSRDLPCARVFRRGEPIYKCSTCALDETCALCASCFHPEQHEDHVVNVTVCQRENGGLCDCGDPEAWVDHFNCTDGPGPRLRAAAEIATDIVSETASDGKTHVELAIEPAEAVPEVPEEFETAFSRTVDIILDYIIDVMCQSDLQFDLPWNVAASAKRHTSLPLDARKYGSPRACGSAGDEDPPSQKYSLIAYNSQALHFRDAVQRIHLASKKVPEFAEMVAEQIHRHGRARVIQSRRPALLAERRKSLSATGLVSCIRNARDEFRENTCHELVLWLGGLVERDVFKRSDRLKNALCRSFCSRWECGLVESTPYSCSSPQNAFGTCRGKLDAGFRLPRVEPIDPNNAPDSTWYYRLETRWNVPRDLSEQCQYDQSTADYEARSFRGSRFQYMVFLDVRFWKSIRVVLHTIYSTSIITNLRYKTLFCCQHVDIYPAVADIFLGLDSESEVNIKSTLSTQLFTCLFNSTAIIDHGEASRIYASVFNFLRTGSVPYASMHNSDRYRLSLNSLKNRRWGQILFDIGYILGRGRDRNLVLRRLTVPMVCDILTLFQGKPVMVREKDSHVEYESSDYTAFFLALLVIYQLAEFVAHSVSNLDPVAREAVALQAIVYVVRHLLELEKAPAGHNYTDHNCTDYGGSLDCALDTGHECVDDARAPAPRRSFIHTLHSFLAWLIEFARFDSAAKLVRVLDQAYAEFSAENPTIAHRVSLALVYQYPVRTLVLSSQINAGYWVRNGFSVRTQLQLYKSTALRDQGYLRDLFLVQTFVAVTPPDVVVADLLKLWCFYDWATSDSLAATGYEPDIFAAMLEKCVSSFIHLLTEDLFLSGASRDETTHRKICNEIIHNLCFAPMSFLQLCAQIPDHIAADKRFETTLNRLALFKAPHTASDIGVYTLREQYLDDVNPFYFNYTVNKKDDAVRFVKERMRHAGSQRLQDIVIAPRLLRHSALGVYAHIGNFTTAPLFAAFLAKVVRFVHCAGASHLDGMADTVLHLVHVCAMEETVDHARWGTCFARLCERPLALRASLVLELYALLHDDAFECHHAKVRAIFAAFAPDQPHVAAALAGAIDDFDARKLVHAASGPQGEYDDARKKRMARNRQCRLMAKFRKQQTLFVRQNGAAACDDADMADVEEPTGSYFPDHHCIVCQDTSEGCGPIGLLSHVARTSEFRTVPFDDAYWFLRAFSDTNLNTYPDLPAVPQRTTGAWDAYMARVERDAVFGPGFADPRAVHCKVASLTCGHGMHYLCYVQYLSTCRPRLSQLTRNPPDVMENHEFLCPLCKSLNNMFIPVLWLANRRSLAAFVLPRAHEVDVSQMRVATQVHQNAWFETYKMLLADALQEWLTLAPDARLQLQRGDSSTGSRAAGYVDLRNGVVTANSLLAGNSQANPQSSNSRSNNTASSPTSISLQDGSATSLCVLMTNMQQLLSMLSFPHDAPTEAPTALVYSIKSAEIALRGLGTACSVALQLTNNTLINLRALNEFRTTLAQMDACNWLEHPADPCDAPLRLLAHVQCLADRLPETILCADFLEVLIATQPVPQMGLPFHAIVRTCFVGSIIQAAGVLAVQMAANRFFVNDHYSVLDVPVPEAVGAHEAAMAAQLFCRVYRARVGDPPSIVNASQFGYVLYTMLLKAVTPFLRQALVYAYVCCADTEGVDLVGGGVVFEADQICVALHLAFLRDVLEAMVGGSGVSEARVLERYLAHVASGADNPAARTSLDYPGHVRLIALPERLDRFFTDYYYLERFQHPYLTIENPAVCMYCACVVDVQKRSVDSRFGQCSAHFATECANSVGVFLLPKERAMVLLHRNGGSFCDAPYLDQHGELAGDSIKSKTVHLLHARYDDFIRNMWLLHNIPNYIARRLDSTIDAGGWETL